MGGSKLKAFPHLPQVKEREKEWEESRRGRHTGLSDGVFKHFEVSTCGMEGAYKTGTDLFQSE